MSLTLIHSPQTRSSAFIWLLEELEAPYELKRVTIRHAGQTEGLDPANPHPHGKVPGLIHDGVFIHEQTAIALYLTDLFPKNRIGPQIGDPKRGPYLTWLAYYSGVAEPAFVSAFLKMEPPRGTAGWVKVDEVMAYLIKTLGAQPYLLGNDFSAADLLFGGTFNLFSQSPLLPKSDVIRDYAQRCVSRPAAQRAQAKDAG
ncbi:MAG: glutathione S-transferase family protein [Alphaproteobacteria bacterium]|nr:glutathione S-transferase family protein [Alphaproteobacteria bacterium]